MEDSKEEKSITTTKTFLPLPPALKTYQRQRGFLGMAGTVWNWIKSFAEVSNPLTKLTRVTKMGRGTEISNRGDEEKGIYLCSNLTNQPHSTI